MRTGELGQGGFLETCPAKPGPWFLLEVTRDRAPWAFTKGDTKKVIAALELLATLIGVKLWISESNENRVSRVAIRGYTDNLSNESLLRKFMTSKFPSTLVLMELAEELSFRHCELKLQWIRRDMNQLADYLTNEKFQAFDPRRRIALIGGEMKWRVLGAPEVRSHRETKPARFQKGTKRRRLDPW